MQPCHIPCIRNCSILECSRYRERGGPICPWVFSAECPYPPQVPHHTIWALRFCPLVPLSFNAGSMGGGENSKNFWGQVAEEEAWDPTMLHIFNWPDLAGQFHILFLESLNLL